MPGPARPAIDALLELVTSPPDGGFACVDCGQLPGRLRFDAPADDREIVARYGAGQFSGEFSVFAHGDREGQDTYERSPTVLEVIGDPSGQDFADSGGDQWVYHDSSTAPIDLIDAAKVFAPWGGGSGGGYGYWHKIGDNPDGWLVVYTDLAAVWLYDRGGLASFITIAFTGQFPEDNVHPSVWERPELIRFPG